MHNNTDKIVYKDANQVTRTSLIIEFRKLFVSEQGITASGKLQRIISVFIWESVRYIYM